MRLRRSPKWAIHKQYTVEENKKTVPAKHRMVDQKARSFSTAVPFGKSA
jgi:hypothetical protein